MEATNVNKTKLTSPAAPVKLVKLRAIRDISIDGNIYPPGSEVDCPEDLAQELCTPVEGSYAFSGHRSDNDAQKHQLVRAMRV